MTDKRLRKLEAAKPDLNDQLEFGDPDAQVAITGIGSTKAPILEAMQRLQDEGIHTKYMQIRDLWPFPHDDIRRFTRAADILCVVEHNATGQLSRLIREEAGLHSMIHEVLKYDGTPFTPGEVYSGIRGAL